MTRKRNTNPGVEKRGNSWCARYYDIYGKRRSKNFKTKADAVAFKREQEIKVQDGTWTTTKTKRVTLNELIEIWRRAKAHLTAKTWATYESQLQKYIIPNFGTLNVDSIRVSMITEWMQKAVTEGAGVVSVNRTLALLSQIFEYGVLDNLVKQNPCKRIKKLTVKRTKPSMKVIDEITVKKLADKCEPYSHFITTAVLTGMRWGELTALRIKDIDFQKGIITVSKAHSTNQKGALVEASTKTGEVRYIEMTKKLRDLLTLHTQGRDPDDYLFKGPKQRVLHYNWFRTTIWKPAVERLGIENFTFRGLRRTFASLMISKHAPVTVVSAVLGHSTVRTTLEAYAHFYEADKIEYLERVALSV